MKSYGKNDRRFIVGKGESIVLLEGSQSLPVCLSEKTRVKVKMLGWLESVAGDRGHERYFKSCLVVT